MSRLKASQTLTAISDIGASLRVAVIAQSETELHSLVAVLQAARYNVVYNSLVSDFDSLVDAPDVWVLRVDSADNDVGSLIETLVQTEASVVIDDATEQLTRRDAEYYKAKIEQAHYIQTMERGREDKVAENVWVLGASAGGPEAVIAFLDALDDVAFMATNSAFVYAQHIDSTAIDALIDGIQRHTSLRVQKCRFGELIQAGHIYVMPPENEVEISDGKSMKLTTRAWRGDYSPSISQVIAKVARVYKQRSGALIFSGMGDDGADAVKMMKAKGGVIYCQSLETCAVDSMPRQAQCSGGVDSFGSPQELAEKCLQALKRL